MTTSTTTGFINEQSLEKQLQKQMGCMTGLLQLFDRHHMLTGKRLYTTKRLPPPTGVVDVSPESEKSVGSPPISRKLNSPQPSPSPDRPELCSPTPHPLFEVNEGGRSYSWKFSKETPRLSLDSRATFDAAEGSLYAKQIPSNSGNDDANRRSTSVIAKLMGLEPIPEPSSNVNKSKQTRSESKIPIDISEKQSHRQNQQLQRNNIIISNVIRERYLDQNFQSKSPRGLKLPQPRKNLLHSADTFPERKQTTVSTYGEIERRLRMRGINEPSKDLETLKQILEAMQLKGLLHSTKPHTQIRHKNNIVYDPISSYSPNDHSPIMVVKPLTRRTGSQPPSNVRPKTGVVMKSPIIRGRYPSSPTPSSEDSVKNSNPNVKTQRRMNESVNSRKLCSTRNVPPDHHRSPRRKHKVCVFREDESSSSVSGSSYQTERCNRTEEYREGKSLLERCDKLLNSIAQMNAAELQPSPVSVLDSSLYKDDSCSPSPVMKRSISFTEDEPVELEEELVSCCSDKWKIEEDDYDFIYISHILRASTHYSKEADSFLLLEKQQYLKGKDTSKVSRLHRKLIFDTITEIRQRYEQTPPWKAFLSKKSRNAAPTIRQIWTEFQRIRERDKSEDLFGIVCGVLKRDLNADTFDGWGDFPVEMSDAVLDIERLIFKDLVGESIRHLAEFAGKYRFVASCRKLVF